MAAHINSHTALFGVTVTSAGSRIESARETMMILEPLALSFAGDWGGLTRNLATDHNRREYWEEKNIRVRRTSR